MPALKKLNLVVPGQLPRQEMKLMMTFVTDVYFVFRPVLLMVSLEALLVRIAELAMAFLHGVRTQTLDVRPVIFHV